MLAYRGEFTVDSAPGGTRLTISGRAELAGWRRILEPMMRAECRRTLRRELESIRDILVPAPARPKARATVAVATAAPLALALALMLPLAAARAGDAPRPAEPAAAAPSASRPPR